MKKESTAVIELRDLEIKTDIGNYNEGETKPEIHQLDLSLGISVSKVVIYHDHMDHVFDYDPLIKEIERLAADGHYETQERLMTRIAIACSEHSPVERIEICLKKSPVLYGSGSLGVRLTLDEIALNELRQHHIN